MRKRIIKIFLATFLFGLFAGALPAADEPAVYYLFELPKSTEGCSDCYVPMLISDEEIRDGQKACGTFLTTYERDSLWSISGEVAVEPRDIHAQSRQITINEKEYRYQQVAFSELEKILANPLGTIPISRISDPTTAGEFQALRSKYLAPGAAITLSGTQPILVNVPESPSILDRLAVESFSFSPAAPREGDTVTIKMMIKNNSSSQIDGVTVTAVDQNGWGKGAAVNFAPSETKAVELVIFARSVHTENNPHQFTVKFSRGNFLKTSAGGTLVVKSVD